MIDFEGWSCPAPLRDTPHVVAGHGGGGAMSAELVRHLIVPGYGDAGGTADRDCAVVEAGGARLAFTTDAYVVQPMFFPGGSIGDLAVNGTVNDLAMAGATPLYLSAAFILEEGTPLADLGRITAAMGAAATAAGVRLVTGDTKVVGHGNGDGVYLTTSGVGVVADGVEIEPRRATVGDAVLVSGDLGRHGVAVLSCREGLEFGTTVASDTAPLHGLVAAMLATGADLHVLRDPTRGGLAAALNEIAATARVGVELTERDLPVPDGVADACHLLGLDPLQVANEGRLVAFVDADQADDVLAAMRAHPYGTGARRIGTCVADHPGMVVARTALGGTRVISMPIGEQLPRIC
ncbi:hydrogenase expression/formation protein HypE [Actinoplanes campanulatus]|uniref:Hydrogenase expression/formation protein HypE n=1 Tax=Actinoplanes campanulatus TaxID=113559 RepID=A0A7W5ADS5_9ACTN|nr:hydrogenase expression/formation protein HypE [Actinoplanes campanulatus]MBB3094456.1 hydrogenase expression/formation protein HypE [Actinoplanes campanulatus]GGN21156.1 hydrogenase expression/formation protein HypE [Actinoplanes campanulatus]GID35630.1 hydrogenase expression/formation protein HypE [Actinoplanes campanulatus]